MTPHFIGLGAQRSGTTWIYSCLYDHPEIFIPQKELHFFSRERNWQLGYDWYESRFRRSRANLKAGEFSTSYLFDARTPERIARQYPSARLICSLRNPVDRAISNFVNDIRAGALSADTRFREALDTHPEYIEQGFYADQVERYLDHFPPQQLKILIYEDSLTDPYRFVRGIYDFLGVDPCFRPAMLETRLNAARVPKSRGVDTVMNNTSLLMQRAGLDRLVWLIKRTGLHRSIQKLNSSRRDIDLLDDSERSSLHEEFFSEQTRRLEGLLQRKLQPWKSQV